MYITYINKLYKSCNSILKYKNMEALYWSVVLSIWFSFSKRRLVKINYTILGERANDYKKLETLIQYHRIILLVR